jgi:hypothetical protein
MTAVLPVATTASDVASDVLKNVLVVFFMIFLLNGQSNCLRIGFDIHTRAKFPGLPFGSLEYPTCKRNGVTTLERFCNANSSPHGFVSCQGDAFCGSAQ